MVSNGDEGGKLVGGYWLAQKVGGFGHAAIQTWDKATKLGSDSTRHFYGVSGARLAQEGKSTRNS
jgi:hypothetical protein